MAATESYPQNIEWQYTDIDCIGGKNSSGLSLIRKKRSCYNCTSCLCVYARARVDQRIIKK